MTQSFRAPPRQISFRAQKLSQASERKTSFSAQAQDPRSSEIKKYLVQLQQLKTRYRGVKEKAIKSLAPQTKQAFEKQLQQLARQIKDLESRLLQLKGQARMELLRPRIKILQSDQGLAELYRQELAELEAIYRVHHPMQKAAQNELNQLFASLQALSPHVRQDQHVQYSFIEEKLQPFLSFLFPPEAKLFQSWWQNLCQILEQHNDDLSQAPLIEDQQDHLSETESEDDDFEPLSFDTDGDLEISFDFSAGKSVVRNQMGITLNKPKMSYQDYLDEGFESVDVTVASDFKNLKPLYSAVESFLEAVSIDKSRYEAYFGLGYLYSLVKDLNHAIYFLDVAYKISADPAIYEMMSKVKASNNLAGALS